jgi:regulator of CtrA degradation
LLACWVRYETSKMAETADLSPTIVEALYCEALELADQVRAAFDLSGRLTAASEDEDLARVALSCEALRTTTRMMHAIAWLLNQRAYLSGELSEFQLRRHGRLPPARADGQDQAGVLGPALTELIERTRRFYARIERLDQAWRTRFEMQPAAIHRLRERLGLAVVGI